ncbi:DNA-binding protein [Vulcanisaeta distributa]|uniref:DNA-binding protein n=1 Tax=Vulcanisaeta distributa TaxID=164451 RepID=UPI000B12699B|nr:DNA-binding protein [Vulcanisaeta distributa]
MSKEPSFLSPISNLVTAMSIDIDEAERRRIMMKMMMELMNKTQQKVAKRELTRDEIIQVIREITKGDRAGEIIDNALQLYGDTAVQVFKQLVELYLNGRLSELQDYELYQILERVGLHVPLRTRIRIVRHGREESIGTSGE